MLLMAPSVEEQQFWVARLLKKIQKSGYKATGQVIASELNYWCACFLSIIYQHCDIDWVISLRRSPVERKSHPKSQ